MAEEKQSFIDRLGPTLTSGLVVAFLSAASLGAVAVRDLVITTDMDIAYIKSDITSIRGDLEKFKSPGGRFTAEDGARHETRIEKLESISQQCQDAKTRLQVEIEHLKQERPTNHGYPRTSSSSSDRSRDQSN